MHAIQYMMPTLTPPGQPHLKGLLTPWDCHRTAANIDPWSTTPTDRQSYGMECLGRVINGHRHRTHVYRYYHRYDISQTILMEESSTGMNVCNSSSLSACVVWNTSVQRPPSFTPWKKGKKPCLLYSTLQNPLGQRLRLHSI